VNITSNDIDILIGKCISGNASSEEMAHLEFWLEASQANREIFEDAKKAWDQSKTIVSEENLAKDRQNIHAAISLKLAAKMKRMQRRFIIYKIAALLAFPVLLAVSAYYFSSRWKIYQGDPMVTRVSSPKGHVSKMILPDGTEVWINTGSTISYNTATFNPLIREVQLEGEAYFEVVPDKNRQFRVVTSLADVNVTGTSFNVKAYSESETFEAVLSEGSIEVLFRFKDSRPMVMDPGDRMIYDSKNHKLLHSAVETNIYTAWRNGEILFRDATLNDLVRELERIYDIQFHLKEKSLGDFRFRGMFSYNNNLIDALEKIKRTSGINYYIENKEVWLSKK
jgi:transmembrane sensor